MTERALLRGLPLSDGPRGADAFRAREAPTPLDPRARRQAGTNQLKALA